MTGQSMRADDGVQLNKVAEITLAFWVMKICATTIGETAGDLFSKTLGFGYAVSSIALISVFLVTLVVQMRAKAFNPFIFWTVILSTSTAGTTISDFMDRTLGLGYETGSAILIAILVAVLAVWRLSIGNLSVDRIREPKVELFYWSAILASNTLGTAVGDYLADSSGLGFAGSNLLITSVIAIIAAAYVFTSISRTTLFWAAFVLTRPFGATMGDLLTRGPEEGGLGFGTKMSSAVLLAILAVLVLWSALKPRAKANT